MEIRDFFPIWEQLSPAQQEMLTCRAISRSVGKGSVIHNGSMDCTGLLLLRSGQLRAYILSD